MSVWTPTYGAIVHEDGTYFRVWAPEAKLVEVNLEDPDISHRLIPQPDGTWNGFLPGIGEGTLYRYRLNEEELYPDPASRFQPQGVHGPSQIINPLKYRWTDQLWTGFNRENLIIYELHPGTFADGTFNGIKDRLAYLKDLGITAIELMPLADFPGRWNWGYDGVDLFAPARIYGTPDELRDLVNAAHLQGLAVIIDVVYNHFGPDGAYWARFSKNYFSFKHHTPWGDSINFDDQGSTKVREFFIENALYWLNEFHVDGLRLDATHSMRDESSEHFCAELVRKIRCTDFTRKIHLIAEDHRNNAAMIQPVERNGWGLDSVWSDDFHHFVRRIVCGDTDGYFMDYNDSTQDFATAISKGWFFSGQYSEYFHGYRGTEPAGITPDQLVIFLQNHDQVGNRPHGERLNHQLNLDLYHALSALLICAPQIPLLFMGQEWGAETPFCYFTDHHEELGKLVTKGRRKEFGKFKAFADPQAQQLIPDPQNEKTFEQSKLRWEELDSEPHTTTLKLYKELLNLRKIVVTPKYDVTVIGDRFIAIQYDRHTVFVSFKNTTEEILEAKRPVDGAGLIWSVGKVSEVPNSIHFTGPGAAILERSSVQVSF